jgi:hypothetical protein
MFTGAVYVGYLLVRDLIFFLGLVLCSNDYQMIMAVLYKRLNDTGRNWRHVYKVNGNDDLSNTSI